MAFRHQTLAEGRWGQFSLVEQLANIGSEVGRAARWQNKNAQSYEMASRRALELLDMTMRDSRWRGRLKEISRAREIFCDAFLGSGIYKTTLPDLERYFSQFAVVARLKK